VAADSRPGAAGLRAQGRFVDSTLAGPAGAAGARRDPGTGDELVFPGHVVDVDPEDAQVRHDRAVRAITVARWLQKQRATFIVQLGQIGDLFDCTMFRTRRPSRCPSRGPEERAEVAGGVEVLARAERCASTCALPGAPGSEGSRAEQVERLEQKHTAVALALKLRSRMMSTCGPTASRKVPIRASSAPSTSRLMFWSVLP
jgi:hypothetical protein